ncbi:Mu transposase domain-containing protein [Streptomyces sp. NPDC003011]
MLSGRLTSVGFYFVSETDLLLPLPFGEFECGITLTPKVDRSSRITVRQRHYSVPARFIGQNVRVLLRGNELLVFEKREIAARHPRLARRGEFRAELDHYVENLLAKPGATAGSTALVTARENGSARSPKCTRRSGRRPVSPRGRGDPGADRGSAVAPAHARGRGPAGHGRRDPGGRHHRGRRRRRGPQGGRAGPRTGR